MLEAVISNFHNKGHINKPFKDVRLWPSGKRLSKILCQTKDPANTTADGMGTLTPQPRNTKFDQCGIKRLILQGIWGLFQSKKLKTLLLKKSNMVCLKFLADRLDKPPIHR